MAEIVTCREPVPGGYILLSQHVANTQLYNSVQLIICCKYCRLSLRQVEAAYGLGVLAPLTGGSRLFWGCQCSAGSGGGVWFLLVGCTLKYDSQIFALVAWQNKIERRCLVSPLSCCSSCYMSAVSRIATTGWCVSG